MEILWAIISIVIVVTILIAYASCRVSGRCSREEEEYPIILWIGYEADEYNPEDGTII